MGAMAPWPRGPWLRSSAHQVRVLENVLGTWHSLFYLKFRNLRPGPHC
jgi:hypothetical protein